MSELQNRLDKLALRVDRMGMRVEQAIIDAIRAVEARDVDAGRAVRDGDTAIDREEVEIEQECIRLLALYQPAAVDLRTICTIIKVNNDLERIADLAASIGKKVKHVVNLGLDPSRFPQFNQLIQDTLDVLGRAVRMIAAQDAETARRLIEGDKKVDQVYKEFVQLVLEAEGRRPQGAEAALTMINLAKALERTCDLCTNIAEDIVFLRTGDIIRHAGAFEPPQA